LSYCDFLVYWLFSGPARGGGVVFGGVKIKGRYSIEFKARYISIIIRGVRPRVWGGGKARGWV